MDESVTYKFYHYRVPASEKVGKRHCASDDILLPYHRTKPDFVPHTKGGKTVCIATTVSGAVFHAEANCSLSDNFSYKRGRAIAQGRVDKMIELSTQE